MNGKMKVNDSNTLSKGLGLAEPSPPSKWPDTHAGYHIQLPSISELAILSSTPRCDIFSPGTLPCPQGGHIRFGS